MSGNWSHDMASGITFQERVQYMEYGWIGENLYKGSSCDLRIAMNMWQESEEHREVLDHDYDEGIILIKKQDEVCYIIMNLTKSLQDK
jgi:uncharacterized protein YkwD